MNDTDNAPEGDPLADKLIRDDAGRIVGDTLTPEERSERGRELQAKKDKKAQATAAAAIEEKARKYVIEKGYANPDDAPESIWGLARIAAKERSGSISALGYWQEKPKAPRAPHAEVKGICPTCGHQEIELHLSPEALWGLHSSMRDKANEFFNAIGARTARDEAVADWNAEEEARKGRLTNSGWPAAN